MFKRILRIWHGFFYWMAFRIKYHITYKSVVLVLVGDHLDLDRWAVRHLGNFMSRKYAVKGMIIWNTPENGEMLKKERIPDQIKTKRLEKDKILLLYDYYSFDKFFDNIIFTFLDTPEENLLGRILRETEVNEEEAVCLALYHLRRVPSIKE